MSGNLPPGRRGQVRPSKDTQPQGRGRALAQPRIPAPPGQQQPAPKEETSHSEHSGDKDRREILDELSRIHLCKRPDSGGSKGSKVALRTNHFVIEYKNGAPTLMQYHIDITHERRKLNKEELSHVFWRCVSVNKEVFDSPYVCAYDGGHLLFTIAKLRFPVGNDDGHTFDLSYTLPRDDRESRYSINVRFTGTVWLDMKSAAQDERLATPIQAVDVILRQAHMCPFTANLNGSGRNGASGRSGANDSGPKFIPAGRSFYLRPLPTHPDWNNMYLGSMRMIYPGYFAAAHVGAKWMPLLNVDSSQTAFYEAQPMLDCMCVILSSGSRSNEQHWAVDQLNAQTSLGEVDRRRLESAIKGLRIEVSYRKDPQGQFFTFKVVGLTKLGARQTKFEMRESPDAPGHELSVADYFNQKYKILLKYPLLPCIQVGNKRRQIYVPIELCRLLPDQKCSRKLTEEQTSVMIKYACVNARVREERMKEMVHKSQIGKDEFARSFGLTVNTRQIEVTGRVLAAPKLAYRDERKQVVEVATHQGTWRADRLTATQGSVCRGWGLISFLRKDKERELERFSGELHKACQFLGVKMPQWPDAVEYITRMEDIRQVMERVVKRTQNAREGAKCDLIVVVVALQNAALYGEIKQVAEVQLGVITQVVMSRNVVSAKGPTMSNIALKINAKLGGINQSFQSPEKDSFIKVILQSQPTMFVGVDVSHPSPSDEKSPSIAGILGSVNLEGTRYGATVKIQKQRRESIVFLTDAIKERLLAFYRATSYRPSRIVVFRDGVADSQFKEVLHEEMQGIRDACTSMDRDYTPAITYIVVQKRHHTRFFCVNDKDTTGKAMNVAPGTVVDSTITHPEEFDFYLCSHFGIQGTSRPSHYYVLHDDSRFSSDALQTMTYYLCHVYCRCPRSVSIPTPSYYADLVCTRARYHLVKTCGGAAFSDTASQCSDSSQATGDGTGSSLTQAELLAQVTLRQELENAMYFA